MTTSQQYDAVIHMKKEKQFSALVSVTESLSLYAKLIKLQEIEAMGLNCSKAN